MNEAKRKRLAEVGFQSTTVADFLGLSAGQSKLIEIKLALTGALKEFRENSSLSQTQLAESIGSSQSRVAKMEAGDPHVSLDLIIRALLTLGMTRSELADVLAPQKSWPHSIPLIKASLTLEPNAGHYKFTTCSQSSKPTSDSDGKKTLGA